MATHAGKEGQVKLGSNSVAEVREWGFDQTGETADNTSLDNTGGWRTHKQTLKGWTGNVTCWFDETDTNGQVALTIGASVTLNLYPEGSGAGATYYTGTATVTGVSRKGAVDGIVEATFSFLGNGAVTSAVVGA